MDGDWERFFHEPLIIKSQTPSTLPLPAAPAAPALLAHSVSQAPAPALEPLPLLALCSPLFSLLVPDGL